MYSEISACPCPPSHENHEAPSPLLQLYRPLLKPPSRLFLRPCRFCLTIHPLLDHRPRSYYPSLLKCAHTHTHTHIHTRARACLGRPLLSLAFVIPSLERLTNLGELERETESEGLSDWIVSSIYTTFGSPSHSLSLFLFSSHERESTRSIYVSISRTEAF